MDGINKLPFILVDRNSLWLAFGRLCITTQKKQILSVMFIVPQLTSFTLFIWTPSYLLVRSLKRNITCSLCQLKTDKNYLRSRSIQTFWPIRRRGEYWDRIPFQVRLLDIRVTQDIAYSIDCKDIQCPSLFTVVLSSYIIGCYLIVIDISRSNILLLLLYDNFMCCLRLLSTHTSNLVNLSFLTLHKETLHKETRFWVIAHFFVNF